MPTSTSEFVTFLTTQTGYAWAWALGIVAVLFLFALGSTAIRAGIRSVLRHVRSALRI